MGCGPIEADAKGEGAFFGDEAPVSLSRAQSEPSIIKERGANGDDDPLVGLSMMAFETAERGLLTDEALRKEASRYVESLYFPMEGRVLSSSTPSDFGRAVLNEGSFCGLASVVNGEEQFSLSIILADGRNGEMTSKGEKMVAGEGVGG